MPASTRVHDPRGIKQIRITDFSAGIQASAPWQTSASNPILVTQPSQPAAIMGKTFGCYALPNGGLTSMPGRGVLTNLNISAAVTHVPTGGTQIWVQGILPVTNNIGGSLFSRIFYSVEYVNGGAWYHELLMATPGAIPISLDIANTATAQGPVPLYPTMPFFSYLLQASVPVQYICFPALIPGTTIGLRCYNPNFADTVIIQAAGVGWFFPHQGRIINVVNFANAITDTDNVIGISFTDPPETSTLGAQSEIFFPSVSDDLSSWGSLSAGELLLLTRQNGGCVVTGDVFSPYVTIVPGLQGTGTLMGQACLSPIGLVYLSGNSGAWVWSGGSSSTKISSQLPGNFYNTSGKYSGLGFNNFGVGFWDNWILVQDNWVYDLVTQSWWQLTLPATNPSYFHYAAFGETQSGLNNGFYASPTRFTYGDGTTIDYFSPSNLTTAWTWASQAILLADGEMVEVDELEVTMSGGATVVVSIETLTGGVTATDTITLASITKPTTFRVPCHVQSDSIMVTVTVTSANTTYPTILHSLSIGYRERWRLRAT